MRLRQLALSPGVEGACIPTTPEQSHQMQRRNAMPIDTDT